MPLLDTLAEESHFVDHLIPVWKALPEEVRGRFLTHYAFVKRAQSVGIPADARALHSSVETGNAVLVASVGDMKTAVAMGYRHVARMEHGAGQSYGARPNDVIARHASYAGGEGADIVSLFLTPNAYSANRWRTAYPRARVEIVGCPKLDTLPAFEPSERPIVAVAFHWNWHVIPETLSAFNPYREAVRALRLDYQVLGHAHPKAAPEVSRFFARNGIEYTDSFDEVCRRASVFVADNSSSLFEFASTGRPVVVLNLPDYRRDAHHGGRFWDWATVGVDCDNPNALRASVARALEDAPEVRAERERVLDLVYANRTGAAERAADALTDWLANLPAIVDRPWQPGQTMSREQRVDAYRAAV